VAHLGAPRAKPTEYDEDELIEFLELSLDTHLDTSDVGVAPTLWSDDVAVTPAQLLQLAGAEVRALSGVDDDAEWDTICAEALHDWAGVAAAERQAGLRAGGSGLAHVAAEDAALAGVAAGAQGTPAAAFAAHAADALARNARWGFAAKQRALQLLVARAGQ
jgi:hypothetical protein